LVYIGGVEFSRIFTIDIANSYELPKPYSQGLFEPSDEY